MSAIQGPYEGADEGAKQGPNGLGATVSPYAIATADDFSSLYPDIDNLTDIFACNQAGGAPANGGSGDIVFDELQGTWTYQQSMTHGGVGMKAGATSSYRDSTVANGAVGTGAFTFLGVIELTVAPDGDRFGFGKRNPTGDLLGVSVSFRNDGQILAVYDPGGGSAGFENIDQGAAADLIGLWAVACARNGSGGEQIFIRKYGAATQASTLTTRTDDYDDAAAKFFFGALSTAGGINGAIYGQIMRFGAALTESEFTQITGWMQE